MKKIFTLILLFLITCQLIGQNNSWRDGEMEVRIYFNDQAEVQWIYNKGFSGDYYRDNSGVFYLTPNELEEVQGAGLKFEVQVSDLNTYSKNFWNNRDEYHSYEDIIQVMNTLAFSHSAICQKFNYGTSVEGRELAALKISDNVASDENEPEIGFDGGIHGNEIGGSENLIRFAEFLCDSYGTDPEITSLINTREIWLYIMVNPDGRANMTRENANNVDLNRDWGYMWDAWGGSPGTYSQVETKAMRNWFYENQFVVHTTYHSGTEELVYPWSYRPDPTPDDAHIDHLAYVYVSSSGYTNLEYGQGYDGLYPINGSSKDTYYGVMGSVGWTMEISNDKQPPTSQIMQFYSINESAMIAMIKYSGYGIRGTITDEETGEPVPGVIFIDDSFPVYADPVQGDYHKYLVEGSYTVTAMANGYEPSTKYNINVPNLSVATCNFSLVKNGENYAYRVTTCQIEDNNFDDEGYTPAVFGSPDDINYSLGKDGWIVLDMHQTILDGPGQEIRIYEGDDSDEGYECFVSQSMDGPWTSLGLGFGTETFDFTDQNIEEARFIKLEDDGDGPSSGDNAGFDLDAIEALAQPYIVSLNVDCDISDPAGNNNHRLDPGETAKLVFTLRNHGGRTANMVRGHLNFDTTWITVINPDLYFGTIAHTETVSASVTITVDEATPVGEMVMTVLNITANDGDYNQSFPGHYAVGAVVEDWETGDFENYDWIFTEIPWVISPIFPYEGIFSAKSANINDFDKSGLTISMDVTGYDDISFYRKVSSEQGADFLKFYIDGVVHEQWSGLLDWELVTIDVSPGYHTFKWLFEKDESVSHGYDCGWIDWITLPSYNIDGELRAIANASPHELCGPGEAQMGAYAIGGTGNYTYNWTPDYNITSTTYQFPMATPEVTTTYMAEVNDGEETVSPEITVRIHPVPETPVVVQQGDSLISSADSGNQWFKNSVPIFGATGKVYYPQTQDTYFVMVTTEYGCKSDTSNKVDFLFTNIDELNGESILRIYPNPTRDQVKLYIPATGQWLIRITDLTGRITDSFEMTGEKEYHLNTESYREGIYLIKAFDGKNFTVRKLMKLHW